MWYLMYLYGGECRVTIETMITSVMETYHAVGGSTLVEKHAKHSKVRTLNTCMRSVVLFHSQN